MFRISTTSSTAFVTASQDQFPPRMLLVTVSRLWIVYEHSFLAIVTCCTYVRVKGKALAVAKSAHLVGYISQPDRSNIYPGSLPARKLKKGSLQIKKRNLEAKQSRIPRICVEEHAYGCCSYPNPRL
ncbi:hypothetical protein PIB30_094248, partial [Stylosanthes scabra]|nr:hypothetical protein [Stylosanthes scabra]